jgi:hypothetical protein
VPSVSQAQQKYFGAIKGGAIKKPTGMSSKVVDEFASTPRKGLPERAPKHLEDGLTNTTWQQGEGVRSGRASDWMERVRPKTAPADAPKTSWMERVRPKASATRNLNK